MGTDVPESRGGGTFWLAGARGSDQSRDHERVGMSLRAAKFGTKSLNLARRGINNLGRDFNGVPHGPRRASKMDEDAIQRINGINGSSRVFSGAVVTSALEFSP